MNLIKDGNNQLRYIGAMQTLPELEPKNYVLGIDKTGYFLTDSGTFSFTEKIYDVDKEFIDHALKTWKHSSKNLGILLKGKKGQGKSVTAKQLCIQAKLPVILIQNKLARGGDFITFLNSIEQDIIIFVDEFEKLFSFYEDNDVETGYYDQAAFLSLTDGAVTSKYKKLFIFTANGYIDDKFLNRPSRVRYYKEYNTLSQKIYDEIVLDKLDNKEFEQDLRDNLSLIDTTIDILNAVIEEINLHNMPFSKFRQFFNFHTEQNVYIRTELTIEGKEINPKMIMGYEILPRNQHLGELGHVTFIEMDTKDNGLIFRATKRKYDPETKENIETQMLVKYTKLEKRLDKFSMISQDVESEDDY